MGMNIRLFPRDFSGPGDIHRSQVCFELNKWVDSKVLATIQDNAESITLPVEVQWVDKPELRPAYDIDPGHTWLVRAQVLKPLTFDHPDWPPSVKAYHKAIEAFIWELPDDWPIIVYYI